MSQSEGLNPAQIEKLTQIAKSVVAKYESLELIEILNRIHLITNLDYQRCIAGFKKMFAYGLIKPEFVLNAQRLPALERTIATSFPFIDAMQAEIVGVGEVLDGPTDEADEETQEAASGMTDLSHLNTNF